METIKKPKSPVVPLNVVNTNRIVSLFSGCGGLDLGFIKANESLGRRVFDIIWANDFEPAACKTYARNCGEHIVCGDIREVDFGELKDGCDIILGGFPCQDFSVLWKRGGIETDRGNLYLSFVKAIEVLNPLMFIGENVKGLLSANKGMAIKQIINDFEEKGYNVSCYLYNVADFGVPQYRERVIIAGIRSDAIYNAELNTRKRTRVFFPEIPRTHLGRHMPSREALQGVENVQFNNERINIKPKTEKIIGAISPGGNFTDIPVDSPLYVKGMISHVYRRLHPERPSTTIIAGGGGGTWGYHYAEPRPLTNRERARLQSFPDDFVFEGSIAEVRKQIGNAVPPRFAKVIAEFAAAFLSNLTFENEKLPKNSND